MDVTHVEQNKWPGLGIMKLCSPFRYMIAFSFHSFVYIDGSIFHMQHIMYLHCLCCVSFSFVIRFRHGSCFQIVWVPQSLMSNLVSIFVSAF